MKRSLATLTCALATVVLVAACDTGNDETTVADTTTMPGTDTVNMPTAVPTTDTMVTKTQISTDTNVIQGDARDTVRRP